VPHVQSQLNGKDIPSVTEILGIINPKWKEFWWRKVGFAAADKISRESAELGRNVHEMIDTVISGRPRKEGTPQEENLFRVWLKWFIASKANVIAAELLVISKKKKYSGTLDAVISLNGKEYLTDWKISKADDKMRVLQLAGYAYAYKEQTGTQINDGLIVRVDPVKKTVSELVYPNLWKRTKDFLKIKAAYDVVQKTNKGKKQKD